jgi:hypothetical protein
MHSWQLALLIIVIGIALMMMATFYMRPRAKTRPETSAYSKWKLLLFLGILITVIGGILALLPENLWWT